jgi:hypothetical protein
MALIGTQTLSCPVGAPLTMTFQLDAANTPTGQMLAYKNDSGHDCIVRVGIYTATAASAGIYPDVGMAATAILAYDIYPHSASNTAGTIVWTDGCDVLLDNYYLTIYNTGNNNTATVATGMVGYAVIQLWPVALVV